MKYKILAVDDNPINIKLLNRALVDSNYVLFTASSGQEALALAAEHRPDLVLLDVIMPGMDGYEVCRRLQENEQTSHTQVIFLSAKNESVDKARGLALGAIDYLTKPFDVLEINARIRNHLKVNDRNIQLIRKVQELEARLEQKNNSDESDTAAKSLKKLLEKIEPEKISVNTKRFKLHALVQNPKKPASALFYSHPVKEDGLFSFAFSGLDRDYPTAMLKLLMQKYLQGFAAGSGTEDYTLSALTGLVNGLMDVFPDDVFDVAYTFILSYLDFSRKQALFFTMHQNTPIWFQPDARWKVLEGDKLPIDSEYATMIKAVRTNLPEKGMLFQYQNGLQKLPQTLFEENTLSQFKHYWKEPAKWLEFLREQLPNPQDDRLMAAVSLV